MSTQADNRTRTERARDEMPAEVYEELLAEALRLIQEEEVGSNAR